MDIAIIIETLHEQAQKINKKLDSSQNIMNLELKMQSLNDCMELIKAYKVTQNFAITEIMKKNPDTEELLRIILDAAVNDPDILEELSLATLGFNYLESTDFTDDSKITCELAKSIAVIGR